MDCGDFKSHFRLKRETVEHVLSLIVNQLQSQALENRLTEVDPLKQLLITLWTYATPESYRSISNRFHVSKSSVFRILRKCSDCLFTLAATEIQWPSQVEAILIADNFTNCANFPGVIGAIDGTHITIKAPMQHPESYVNRHRLHSIVLQAVCDRNLKFLNCYAGQPGSLHDARIFRLSTLRQNIEGGIVVVPPHCHLLGDSAYPLCEYLLTPYRDTGNLSAVQVNYNHKHSATRMAIERAFGKLKSRFRRLQFFHSPDIKFIVKSVIACCTLHNVCIVFDDDIDDENIGGNQIQNLHAPNLNQHVDAIAKRNQIAATL